MPTEVDLALLRVADNHEFDARPALSLLRYSRMTAKALADTGRATRVVEEVGELGAVSKV